MRDWSLMNPWRSEAMRLLFALAALSLLPATSMGGDLKPGDIVSVVTYGNSLPPPAAVILTEPDSGDQSILSVGNLVNVCTSSQSPWPCCTGAGSGDGTPPCVSVGTGPGFFGFQHFVAVDTLNGRMLVYTGEGIGSDPNLTITSVDPTSGDRAIVSTQDRSLDCQSSGVPWACCTGSGTGNGQPPCAEVGTQVSDFGNQLAFGRGFAVVPPSQPQSVASLPTWGLALLAGLLIGLTLRTMRTGAVRPT